MCVTVNKCKGSYFLFFPEKSQKTYKKAKTIGKSGVKKASVPALRIHFTLEISLFAGIGLQWHGISHGHNLLVTVRSSLRGDDWNYAHSF